MRRTARGAAAFLIAALALAGVTSAHHSQAMFGDSPVWVTGVIVRYRPVDPHAMIELHESQAGGPDRKWIIEGPRRGRLEQLLRVNGGIRDDQLLKIGDRVSACGFPLRSDWNPDRMYPDWPPEQGRFVHSPLLVLPDGRMQSWGPYGRLDACVRPGDSVQAWVEFLNRDPLAHRQWCDAIRRAGKVHTRTPDLADEVGRGLTTACR